MFRHALWAVAAVVLAGCVAGSGASSQPPTVTTGVPGVGVSALSPLGASTTTIVRTTYQLGLDTPEAAAKNLWDAWRDNDRTRALMAADETAVSSLFEDSWGPEVDEQGCVAVLADVRYRCAFVQGSAARIIEVNALAGRYRVTGVDRIGNLATSSGPQAGNRPGPIGGPTTIAITRAPRPKSPTTAAPTPDGAVSAPDTSQATTAPANTRPRVRSTAAPIEPDPAPQPTPASTPVPVQARAAASSVG